MSTTRDVTDTDFEAQVLKADIPVLVDFWAPWCGPCLMIAPVIEELSSAYEGKVKFVRLNTDDNIETAARYGIRSIPTLAIFKGGQQVSQLIGFRPKGELQRTLEKALG